MKIQAGNVKLNLRPDGIRSSKLTKPVVLLHGMTLSGRDWDPVMEAYDGDRTLLAPDLVGHGKSEAPENESMYKIDSVLNQLVNHLDKIGIEKADWVGYSMGGRILLHLAVQYPGVVNSMVLESTTAGMENEQKREKRVKKDEKLARYLEKNSLEEFVDHWLKAPVFETQRQLPEKKRERARQTRLEANPEGIASSLRMLSRGRVPPVWDSLEELTMPVLLISGERDEKHRNIHRRMESELPNVQSRVVETAGHNVHFERPERFTEQIRKFWNDR